MSYKVTEGTIDELKFAEKNPVKHNKLNESITRSSIEEFGLMRSISVNEDNEILAGNGTTKQAKDIGVEKVIFIDVEDENTLVAVRRSGLSEEDQLRYAVADNAAAKTAIFDDEIMLDFKQRGLKLNTFLSEKYLEGLGKTKTPQEAIKEDYPQSETKYFVIVECDDEDTQEGLYQMLTDEGHEVMKYSGDRQKQNRGQY